MPSCSMRPNMSPTPPGVQASRLATSVIRADEHHRAEHQRRRAPREAGERHEAAVEQRNEKSRGDERQQHGERRVVGCG